ncbi:MAG: RloB family protein [Planctomycetia bacterium]|nr:RloB family protein [Planctomycetia bacterium]
MSKGRRLRRSGLVRRRAARPEKSRILIVGEGRETEPNYFDGLKREDAVTRNWAVTVKSARGQSPEAVIERTVNLKRRADDHGEAYDHVWCVLDVEGGDKHESLIRALARAGAEGISLCLSNPAFEVWFLAHYERTAKSFADADAVIRALNKHWRKHHHQDYAKSDSGVHSRLATHTEDAIENARWVSKSHRWDSPDTIDRNSSTDVFKLVTLLMGPAPPVA